MPFKFNVVVDFGKDNKKSILEMLTSKLLEGILCYSEMSVQECPDEGSNIYIDSSDNNPFTLDVFIDKDGFVNLICSDRDEKEKNGSK